MKTNWESLIENHYNKGEKLNMNSLVRLVEQVMDSDIEEVPKLDEKTEKRFSMTIPIPKLTPSEAWGDPDSQSRKEIDRIFASISGGKDLRERINTVNKFLNIESAKRKRSPSAILNMMMITEALQATLNDFNESASGFVFEGFLAALTGGKQQAGKVAGTLPIEDFVAFSEFGGPGTPVSLKLLSGTTPIKGSFTNIVDFLLVRGAPEIKYLIAYKLRSGKDIVEKLNILGFDINLDNFIDFIYGVSGGYELLRPVGPTKLKQLMQNYRSSPNDENKQELTDAIRKTYGYSSRGLLNKMAAGDDPTRELSPEEEEEREKEVALKRKQAYDPTLRLGRTDEELNEGSVGTSQWAASRTQLDKLSSKINLESYGELDLSQGNIDNLVEIYSDILGEELLKLLKTAKELTENIGTYFGSDKRSKATAANLEAQQQSDDVKNILSDDPRYKK